MVNDTLTIRGWFGPVRIPWDEVVGAESGWLIREGGTRYRVQAKVAEQVRVVSAGPHPAGSLQRNGVAFAQYLAGPWSPRRAAHALLNMASAAGASDVHLEPGVERMEVRFRLAGSLVPFTSLRLPWGDRLVAALKAISGCVPYRRDLAQEGRVPRDGVAADVRTAFLPTALGERVAIRLFGRLLDLGELGFPPTFASAFRALLESDRGLLVVAGPSGGGKTTTLYAALAAIAARRSGAHLSLEDPVEQRLRVAGVPVDQVELAPMRGLTGEAALVAALRQDIDVLAVGEVRTPAEAVLALKAAHTGRLVLAGLHAGSSLEARQRLLDLGLDARVLDDCLVGVLHQRLVTRSCDAHLGAECPRCRGLGMVRNVEADLWVPPRSSLREVA